MLGGDVDLAGRQGDAAGLIQHDQHLLGQVRHHVLRADVGEVRAPGLPGPGLALGLGLEVLEFERALVGQAGERPAGGGLGQAQRGDEGHLGHERRLAPGAHDLAGPIQDQARVGVKEVGVEIGHA